MKTDDATATAILDHIENKHPARVCVARLEIRDAESGRLIELFDVPAATRSSTASAAAPSLR